MSAKVDMVEMFGFEIIEIRRQKACSDKTARDICTEPRQG